MFTVIPGPNGTIRYKKDARFVKKADIPADILIKLNVGMTQIEESPTETEKKCIFCGQVTKGTRLYNSQAIPICQDDYYSKTMGQIAQKLRQDK